MKKILVLILLISAFGCAKKQDTVLDPGPLFQLKSLDLKIADLSTSEISLKRSEPQSGPQFQIDVDSQKDFEITDKLLQCGPLNLKVAESSRRSRFFKLNSVDFPKLETLPRKTSCTLTISAKNTLGSTATEKFPLIIAFDEHQRIEVIRTYNNLGIVKTIDSAKRVLIDAYTINNSLDYDIGFYFKPQVTSYTHVAYGVFGGPFGGHSIDSEKFNLNLSTPFVISESTLVIKGNGINELHFKVPSKKSIRIEAWASIIGLSQSKLEPFSGSSPNQFYRFSGFYLVSTETLPNSLFIWDTFELNEKAMTYASWNGDRDASTALIPRVERFLDRKNPMSY